jgi:hypothetical protein
MRQVTLFSLLVATVAFPSLVWAGGSSKSGKDRKGAAASAASGASGVAPAAVGATGRPLNPSDYPYAYRPIGYLGTVGPAPLRFTAATPLGNERTPPRVSASSKKPELSETSENMARTEAIEAYRSVFGRKVPVPAGSAPGGEVDPNFVGPERIHTSVSADEPGVMDFFPPPDQEGKAQERKLRFMFDPLFESATPPVPGVAPRPYRGGVLIQQSNTDESRRASKATFNQVP